MIDAKFFGVKNFTAGVRELDSNVNLATIRALKLSQGQIKRAVKKNMEGAPRYNSHGANRVTGAAFKLEGAPTHAARSGPVGKLTGTLQRGVGGVKRPKKIRGIWFGGVGVGNKVNNVKKNVWEQKYPYFRPAVEKTEPRLGSNFEKSWGRAASKISAKGGMI